MPAPASYRCENSRVQEMDLFLICNIEFQAGNTAGILP
jgi:hypothetical protein